MTDPAAESTVRPLPGPVREAAIAWQVTLWSGEATADELAGLEHWRRQNPLHEQAWQRMQSVGRRLQAVPAPLAVAALRAPAPKWGPKRPPGSRSRRLVLALGLAGTAGLILRAGPAVPPFWASLRADASTRHGERRELRLPDGGMLTLDTDTAVTLRYNERQRRVILHGGRILADTAPDLPGADRAARPFVVETADGEVQASGGRFSVGRLGEASCAEVYDGAVEVRCPAIGRVLRLRRGEQVRFDAAGPGPVEPSSPGEAAWARGLLVAERKRLGELLEELRRYRGGVLRWDPAVADLRVSGVYPLDDPDRVLSAIAAILPVRLTYRTRWWVSVGPRAS
ncbi:MAG: FecR domain-containing protein [Lautropia sp.]